MRWLIKALLHKPYTNGNVPLNMEMSCDIVVTRAATGNKRKRRIGYYHPNYFKNFIGNVKVFIEYLIWVFIYRENKEQGNGRNSTK